MKHFNTHNVWPRNILEPLTPETKLVIISFMCKVISPLCKSVTEVMFRFAMYMNESIESTHRECVRFQGSNFVALFTFSLFCFFSSCSRFGARIVSTVILTNYERTHKATTRQSVWNRFYWQSKIWPPICAPFGTKCVPVFHWNKQSCINIVSCNTLLKLQWNKQQGHRQCHWLKCRLIFIGCCVSLYLIVQTVSECEYCVCVC